MQKTVLIASLLSVMSSCMVGPNYHRPCLDIPDHYYFETPDADKETANTRWWSQFQDPVLDQLIAEGLAHNLSVQIAAANIVQALGVLMQTQSQLYPQIGYNDMISRQRTSESLGSPFAALQLNPLTTFQWLLTATWEIDLWGKIRRQAESSRALMLASEEAHRGVILTLVGTIANTYLLLRGLDEQLAISHHTLKSYEDSVKYFETQFKYGQVSKIEVAQALTQYELAAVAIPQIELQIVQAENALSILLGKNPDSIPRGKSIYELRPPSVPAGIPSEILERRPDVMQAEQNLIAQNALIGAAQALYFPSISLTGFYGGASDQLKNLFTGAARTWNYTGNAIGPIFTFGQIEGQVVQAKAATEAALLSYKLAIQNAFSDVENALAAHSMLTDQLAAQKRLVEASREYERLAKLQYHGGYAPYFAVLQAQQQLFPAELNWVRTQVSLLSAYVSLYQSMGGGWVSLAEEMTHPDCE